MASRLISGFSKQKNILSKKYNEFITKKPITNFLNLADEDKETHTGQKWEKCDYRFVRFVDKKKHVNPNWAIKLISEVPAIPVKGRVTCCDGGSGPTGHPKVYINLDKPGCHSCLYCGLRFYQCH